MNSCTVLNLNSNVQTKNDGSIKPSDEQEMLEEIGIGGGSFTKEMKCGGMQVMFLLLFYHHASKDW